MSTNKFKFLKSDDRIYFDGEYITNGCIAFHKSCGELTDKGLQALVSENIPFSRTYGQTTTGNDASIPDIPRVLELNGNHFSAIPTNFGHYSHTLGWCIKVEVFDKSGNKTDKAFYFQERFIRFMENLCGDFFIEEKAYGKLTVKKDGKILAACMGIRLAD